MTDNIKAFTSLDDIVAKIYNNESKNIVGSGFLISSHYLLTCAHVVIAALKTELKQGTGIPQTEIPQTKIPKGVINLFLNQELTAEVIFWRPCSSSKIQNSRYGEDIAVLKIKEHGGSNETFHNLLSIDIVKGKLINIMGFPEGDEIGVWTEYKVASPVSGGRFQMEKIERGKPNIIPGFSGAPVWDKDIKNIIGMVMVSDLGREEEETPIAFAIASSTLIDTCLKFLELQDILLELDLKTVKKAYTECRQRDLDKPIPETIQEMIISFVDEAKFNLRKENKNLDLNLFIQRLIISLNQTKVIEWKKKYMAILTIDTAREINYDIIKVPNPLKDKYGYIERPDIESECYQKIATEDFIRIKGSVGMGKTWLLKQVTKYAKNQGHFTIRLDFNEPEKAVFDNLKAFYTWFCKKISRILGVEKFKSFIPYTDYHNDPSDNANITHYFEDHLLDNRDDQPKIILAIDNVDRLFTFPNIADDVCTMWRSWYDEDDGKIRNNIIMIITHSTMDYPGFNIDNSPLFNIGHVANLSDWEVPQVKSITQQYNLDLSVIEIDQLMLLIGGHPYLVRKAVEYLYKTSTNVENLLKIATNEDSPFSSYLDQLLQNLENLPELCKIYSQIIGGFSVRLNRTSKFHLDSMGLIKITENQILPKYLLYHNYFLAHLNEGE